MGNQHAFTAEMWNVALTGVGGILFCITLAVLGLLLVRRSVPLHQLKEQHEVAGISFAVIGGFYGVLLAFVLVASWERFERARATTDAEANAVVDLYRQASGLSAEMRASLRGDLVKYARSVIDDEWGAMREGMLSPETQHLYLEIWLKVLHSSPESPKDVALFQCMVQKLDDFGEARRYRLLSMQSALPTAIWAFLTVFGIVTVAFTYFFGMPRLLPQAIITVALTGAIVSTLFIIWEMQTPFAGLVFVPDRAFHVALDFLQDESAAPSSMWPGRT